MRITVKLGGSILEEASIRTRLLAQVAGIASQGHEVILVHGGGKSLNRRLSQMQMESHFKEGLRVTDADTLEVAVMVLAGEGNIAYILPAGLILGLVQSISTLFVSSSYQQPIALIIFILVLMFRPNGLFAKEGR